MGPPAEESRQKLLQALSQSDAIRRDARADRIEWLSLHINIPSFIAGRAETLQLVEEARDTFVDGHFAATLMIAMAVIEHCVVEHLQIRRLIGASPSFSTALNRASENRLFPPDWIERATRLSQRRNPYAHLKDEDHPHALGARIQSENRHPRSIMEGDAKDALELMSNIFIATLRMWPFD